MVTDRGKVINTISLTERYIMNRINRLQKGHKRKSTSS